MKLKTRLTFALALMGLFVISLPSIAAVTVNFSGRLIRGACTISNESMDQSIDMQDIYISDLYLNNRSASFPWKIKLVNCNSQVAKYASVTFEGIEDAEQPGLIQTTGKAQHIAIGLEDDKQKPIPVNSTSLPFAIKDGDMDMDFFAYIKVSPTSIEKKSIVGGDFSGTVTFVVNYE